MFKIKTIILVLLLSCIMCSCSSRSNTELSEALGTTKDKSDKYSIIRLDENMSGGRIVDTATGEIVQNDTIYQPTISNVISNSLVFNQNISGDTEYKLIVMKDFKQCSFNVQNNEYYEYDFVLSDIDDIVLDIEISIQDGESINEIEYFLIRDPKYHFDSKDVTVDERIYMDDLIASSFFWRTRLNDNVDYGKLDKVSLLKNKSKWDFIFSEDIKNKDATLIKKIGNEEIINYESEVPFEKYFSPVFVASDKSDIQLMVSNHFEAKCGYFMIQLVDNKQVAFDDGEYVKYFELEKGENGFYNVKIPKIEEDSNYQILIYPTAKENDNLKILTSRVFIKVES